MKGIEGHPNLVKVGQSIVNIDKTGYSSYLKAYTARQTDLQRIASLESKLEALMKHLNIEDLKDLNK